MKRLCTTNIIFLFFSFFSCTFGNQAEPSNNSQNTQPQDDAVVSGEVVVGIDSTQAEASIDTLVPGVRVKTIATIKGTTYLLYRLNDSDADSVIMSLTSSGKVRVAEKNALYSLCMIPNDGYYNDFQYAPKITHCEDAWDIETGSPDITVGLIDTGINGMHEELAGRVLAGKNMLTGEPIAEGANSDDIGHGTHVAGIIAAAGNNTTGIAGVAWNVKLLPVKIFSEDDFPSSSIITEAIVYAVDHGAKVINMSIGGGVYSMMTSDAVNYAYDHNVLIVAAMGNDGKTKVNYPASFPGVLAVGCTNARDEVSYYSTRGANISVCAPGECIYSLANYSDTSYRFMSGTSMATPFVTGLTALLFSHDPTLTPEEARSMIEDSAEPLGAQPFSIDYGHGRVNANGALTITKRNNYGSIRVNVTNNGKPTGGIKVLLEDPDTSSIVQTGLTSSGTDGGGANGEIVFHHLPINKTYRAIAELNSVQRSTLTLAGAGDTETASFSFNTPMVLIVNGIKIANASLLTAQRIYEEKLIEMGKCYSIWKVAYNGPPPLSLVSAYDTVIWFTGATADDSGTRIEVLNDEERSTIASYLDNGGKMYLCGNNIAEHLSATDPAFLENYLHATFVRSKLPHDELFGFGFLASMIIDINPWDDDQIEPAADTAGLLDASDTTGTQEWAGISWSTGYRLVFTTFTPNEVASCFLRGPLANDAFLESVINWLDSTN
jgi:subtilisin family serine protease